MPDEDGEASPTKHNTSQNISNQSKDEPHRANATGAADRNGIEIGGNRPPEAPVAVDQDNVENAQQSQNRQFLNSLITNETFQLNFFQEMNQRLDFLKFLTKQSNCKTLKSQQINVLWECLVVNAFSEEERDQFFIFCTEVLNAVQIHQYKMQQKSLKSSGNNAKA